MSKKCLDYVKNVLKIFFVQEINPYFYLFALRACKLDHSVVVPLCIHQHIHVLCHDHSVNSVTGRPQKEKCPGGYADEFHYMN